MKYKNLLIPIFGFLYLICVGCHDTKEMNERVGFNGNKILTDSDGRKYFVKHYSGNQYFIEAIKD